LTAKPKPIPFPALSAAAQADDGRAQVARVALELVEFLAVSLAEVGSRAKPSAPNRAQAVGV
jgi:hypothetical protein